MSVVESPVPGMFDPCRNLSPDLARRALVALHQALAPEAGEAEQTLLVKALRRVPDEQFVSFAHVMNALTDQRVVARFGRFVSTPVGSLLSGPVAPPLARTQIWDLRAMLAGTGPGPLAEAMMDLALSVATVRTVEGVLVADEVGSFAPGSLVSATRAALEAARTLGALVATTAAPEKAVEALPTPTTMVVLAHGFDTSPQPVFARYGFEFSAETADWLEGATATIEDGVVRGTALGFIWAAGENPRGISFGPVPLSRLPALTRGAAVTYLADQVYHS